MTPSPWKYSMHALKKDRRFAALIRTYGAPDRPRERNAFRALARSIIFQQVSGNAARSILKRFQELFGTERKFPSPRAVMAMPIEKLRSAGVSLQKASYLHDLAEKFSRGVIKHRRFARMSNDEVIRHLVQIKGVGEWTAHMFLIFTLNRLDILPTGDLGIRKGFQVVYRLATLPDAQKMERLARPWRTHASVASFYLWRVADGAGKAHDSKSASTGQS